MVTGCIFYINQSYKLKRYCLLVCLHILYSVFHFQALSKNGKIFGSDIMVGVQPCIDKVSCKMYFSFFMFDHLAVNY